MERLNSPMLVSMSRDPLVKEYQTASEERKNEIADTLTKIALGDLMRSMPGMGLQSYDQAGADNQGYSYFQR